MTDRKKTLISILSSFLIVILIITNNKSLTMKKEKHKNDNKTVKKENQTAKIPIAFYLCVSNIICLILSNFYILANY